METMAKAAPSLHFTSARCSSLRSPSFLFPSLASTNPSLKSSLRNQALCLVLAKGRRCIGLRCSASLSERWLLEPVAPLGNYGNFTSLIVGDGDSSHIGYKVTRPGAFEVTSSSVTVGRVPEKADIVLPVATVSGLHARLEKKDGSLLVTDLDSTNGTFINENKLRPGAVTPVPPGSYITFGDTNLAIFRVLKEEVESTTKTDESESEPTNEPQALSSEPTSSN